MSLFSFTLLFTGCASNSKRCVSESYVHKYGLEVPESEWAARGGDGTVITTLESGVTVTKNYTGGKLDGETTYSFPHSDLIEKKEVYTDGRLDRVIVHSESGWPYEELAFMEGQVRKTRWYKTGAPQAVETLEEGYVVNGEYFSQDNALESRVIEGEGLRIVRDAYGEHLYNEKIEEGDVVLQLSYHPNGVLKRETPYVGGEIDGIRKSYLPTGEPRTLEHFTAGAQQGLSVVYKNGTVWREVPYVRGERSGVEKVYKNGDEIVQEITWFEDKKHGPTRTYVGDHVTTKWYYMGDVMPKNKQPNWAKPTE